jgi:hypothetical protein
MIWNVESADTSRIRVREAWHLCPVDFDAAHAWCLSLKIHF